jgi:hypothetical protein
MTKSFEVVKSLEFRLFVGRFSIDQSGAISMPNFLEQLVAEWYEFRGYFVRRNINVGPRARGGFESELDVVAFHPANRHLCHIEPSMDAHSWEKREARFAAKFSAGRKFIPPLFSAFEPLPEIEQVALFVFGGSAHKNIGGGNVLLIRDLMQDIRNDPEWGLANRQVNSKAVPEQYTILRSMQFAANYWTAT